MICKAALIVARPLNPSSARGFSLIELMIALAIVAILAAVGYPSYQSHVIKANRAAAQQFMLEIANKEEQYMLDSRAYTATIGTGGLGLTQPSETTARYTFTVDVASCTPTPCYTITATAKNAQLSDGNLTLNNLGTKTPTAKWGS